MANRHALANVGVSLQRLLTSRFAEQQPISESQPTTALLIRTEDLQNPDGTNSAIQRPMLTILVYRVDYDPVTRPGWSGVGARDGRSYLPLDVKFLITPWAANATNELRILGAAMSILDATPVLTGPILGALDAGFEPTDRVHIWMDDLSTQSVMETFESLPIDYKLSVPYSARVVRIDAPTVAAPEIVVEAELEAAEVDG